MGIGKRQASEYLRRIGVAERASLDAQALAELHRAHQLAVPFENLSIHLGEPISLSGADLLDKLVTRRRGGFCYELNGAFAMLLEALGANVLRMGARVYGENKLGPPLDHLALVVSLPDGSGPWLADVGFGSHSAYPLAFHSREFQHDPCGEFQITDTAEGDVEVVRDGEPQYRVELRNRELAEFGPTCWWQQTSPESHFTGNVICSLMTADGRISISGRTLIRTVGESRVEEQLDSDAAVLAAYRDDFGIVLDRVPQVRGAG